MVYQLRTSLKDETSINVEAVREPPKCAESHKMLVIQVEICGARVRAPFGRFANRPMLCHFMPSVETGALFKMK